MRNNWHTYKPLLIPKIKDLHEIEIYKKNDGYKALKKILIEKRWSPQEVIQKTKKANIRGRGGAGFNAGLKWSFMPPPDGKPRYLVCNGDESEPGTFKDRKIFEFNPHLFIEGALIAAYAMQIATIYVYIRGEYYHWTQKLKQAVDQAYQYGYIGSKIMGSLFDCQLILHEGAGAYICGEETALLESLEGKRGYPRVKPPFPAQKGLWGRPTTINNIETLANVPLVINKGPQFFSSIGCPSHPGPLLVGVSGHINWPGVYELPSGVPILDIIHKISGGMRNRKKLKAIIPGGSSTPILRADQLEGVTMDSESLTKAGSMLGTAGMVVMDEDTDIVDMLWRISHFYYHESCGQCTPCREGTGWLEKILLKFKNHNASLKDLDLLVNITYNMEGRTICALADAAAWPVRYTIERFRQEFEERIRKPVKELSSF